ncbi:hypothetical protein DLM45_12625 [Hyphomicrobium methylovorum]|uniref:hypothetical protein n=1 Tax=Hyphomicrobium methylovorum TaxID=84 RepID=UPI0015E7BEAA|nr:hypothetical protein [Hyphomicrobium methylovorum]MBA2127057.1 hypothetical protein [Hyphomicrobium methylovorum]
MAVEGLGRESDPLRIGLVIVHGVGDTEPGDCINAVLDTLAETRPGYTVSPSNLYDRIEETGIDETPTVFPVVRRGARHTSGIDIEAVELHWADLTHLQPGRLNTIFGLFRVIFESHHLVHAMLDRSLGAMAILVRGILWLAAWLLRGPIVGLTAAVSLICAVYVYEPKWFSVDRVDARLQFIAVEAALCVAAVYLSYSVLKGRDYSWYDAVAWLVITSAGLALLATHGSLIGLMDLFPPLQARGHELAVAHQSCLASDPVAACYVNGLYRVLIYGWRLWGFLILVATALFLIALGRAWKCGDRSRLSALSTSIGILVMQFLLWTTIVVTIIYTMLMRAETGSALQVLREPIMEAVEHGAIANDGAIVQYLQIPDLKLEWIARFKFIYAAAALTLIAFLFAAWVLMAVRRRRARLGLNDPEKTAREMPRLLFSPWLAGLLVAAFVIVITFVFFQPELEMRPTFVAVRGLVLPLAALAALLVPLAFGQRVANVITIARDLIDHHYRPRLEAAFFLVPARFRTNLEWPRRARLARRLKRVLESFVKTQKYDGVVFLAHSQGSVLVYDYLRDNAPAYSDLGAASPAFLSFGSPLGSIYQRYFHEYDASRPVPVGMAARLKCWINLYRVDDYIGGPITAPAGLRIDNHVMGLGGHTGYWSKPEIAEALDAILMGKVADATQPPPLPPQPAPASAAYSVRAMRNA